MRRGGTSKDRQPITLSPIAHADGVPADLHEIGSAPGDSQSIADETEPRILIEPANRGAESLSKTDIDAIGDEESLAVTDPRGAHHYPDSDCSAESVDCHPVGDDQPIADCKPVAVLVPGWRVWRRAHTPGLGGRWRVYRLQPAVATPLLVRPRP